MSDIKARYVGTPDGVDLPAVPVETEDEPPRRVHVPHGGELPTTIDGHKVRTSYRDSLLEQKDNWTEVRRDTADKKKTTAATADKKED